MKSNCLAENLCYLMARSKLSIPELGMAIDVATSTIKKLRSGEQENPTLGTLIEISKYFQVSLDDLIYSKLELMSDKPEVNLVPWLQIEDLGQANMVSPERFFVTNYKSQNTVIALQIRCDRFGVFENNGVLVVDIGKHYVHKDYVVVRNKSNNNVSIKKIIIDVDGEVYLQTIIEGLHQSNIFVEGEVEVLGVVVVYCKYFGEAL